MPEEMELEPEAVAHHSARLANTAEAQQEQIRALCEEIRDRNDADPPPWGTDQAGNEFAQGPDGYFAHVNEVLDRCTLHSQNMEDLAVAAGEGALMSEMADEAARDQIQAAGERIDEQVGELHALLDGAPGGVASVLGNPSAVEAVTNINSVTANPQAREQLGQELLGDVEDLMGRLSRPDQ